MEQYILFIPCVADNVCAHVASMVAPVCKKHRPK